MGSEAGRRPTAPGAAPVLEARALRKVFRTSVREEGLLGFLKSLVARRHREMVALEGIDLVVGRGEFVGLIGANGAGKTTLVKLLAGIVPATSGEARLLSRDSFHLRDEEKARLSLVMGQRSQLWWDIPAIDSFNLLREIYRVPRRDFEARLSRFAARLEVADKLETQLRHLSLGQRMKMEIIGAFLHDPEVVFLDEPTIGLDLVSRETIRRFLVEHNRERGATIVLTSHDIEDIEATCKRLVILEKGRVLHDGDIVALAHDLTSERRIEVHLEPSAPEPDPAALPLAEHEARLAGRGQHSLAFILPAARSQAFVRMLFGRLAVRDLAVERRPLEDLVKQIFSGERRP